MLTPMPTAPEPLASTVRAELARRRLRQADAAAHLHMSQQSLNDRLRGRVAFTEDEVQQLAVYLGTDPATLRGQAALAAV